ncbi:uncharacterized protein LOC113780002 [Coffea eugenioides]|uniref:uncharacterized protein LOC113780002 n=1 Tax=Coffea eugenioides TaxID=49369 RepID=UPI000F611192|nr:uncharacterized protein LOC113780002 [Coffea eugenioides]
MSQLASSMSNLENGKGKLPSQVIPNPKENASTMLLRSGKKVQFSKSEAAGVKDDQVSGELEKEKVSTPPDVPKTFDINSPFPGRLAKAKKEDSVKEILDTFRKVKINIPLLDAIRQLPKYAKFLKGLCTNRNKLNVQDKIKVGENVLAVLQRKLPQKCKDPDMTLNLEPLKETRVVIQLTDRSNVYSEGVVEDVLVKVNEFIFPTDFYIVDMNDDTSVNSAVLLLDRSFMSTARIKIDVHEDHFEQNLMADKLKFMLQQSKMNEEVESVDDEDTVEVIMSLHSLPAFPDRHQS